MIKKISKSSSKWFHIQYVENLFTTVVSKYVSNPKTVKKLFTQVAKIYSSPDRHYHDMNHLYEVISMWDAHKHLLKDADAIFIAAIYHDIVYKPKRKDNEDKSQWFYMSKIAENLPGIKHSIVCKAILATKHNSESEQYYKDNKDIQYLLDFDLEILGTRHHDTYEWYRNGVRKEYSMFSSKIYKAGRKAVLEKFLSRSSIYLTPEFKKIEKRARKNLKNEIKLYLC